MEKQELNQPATKCEEETVKFSKTENPLNEQQKLNPQLYTIFRLDGHSFSKFVKAFKMTLPFDTNFTTAMKATAQECFSYFGFFLGFVGSDEITYVLRPLTEAQLAKGSVLEFNGRVQKMVSLLASKVSVTFFIELTKLEGFQKTSGYTPHFDCRVFQVETFKEVISNISERVKFTLKNSRMMLAQSHYNQKQLDKVASRQAVEKLLQEKGIDFNQVVCGDNRVGNALLWYKITESKQITVKGETKTITYERKKCKLANLSPTQVEALIEEDLI